MAGVYTEETLRALNKKQIIDYILHIRQMQMWSDFNTDVIKR